MIRKRIACFDGMILVVQADAHELSDVPNTRPDARIAINGGQGGRVNSAQFIQRCIVQSGARDIIDNA